MNKYKICVKKDTIWRIRLTQRKPKLVNKVKVITAKTINAVSAGVLWVLGFANVSLHLRRWVHLWSAPLESIDLISQQVGT